MEKNNWKGTERETNWNIMIIFVPRSFKQVSLSLSLSLSLTLSLPLRVIRNKTHRVAIPWLTAQLFVFLSTTKSCLHSLVVVDVIWVKEVLSLLFWICSVWIHSVSRSSNYEDNLSKQMRISHYLRTSQSVRRKEKSLSRMEKYWCLGCDVRKRRRREGRENQRTERREREKKEEDILGVNKLKKTWNVKKVHPFNWKWNKMDEVQLEGKKARKKREKKEKKKRKREREK